MGYTALNDGIALFRDSINRRRGQLESLEEQKRLKESRVNRLRGQADNLRQVVRLFGMAGEYARQESKDSLERLVTSALTLVFQADHAFHIEYEERGERSEAEFQVSSTYGGDLEVKNDPRESRGGGVVDVISLALRVALLENSRPSMAGPLILDEPGKHVSEQHVLQVAEFLNAVCSSFGRQVIMVTHNQHLAEAGSRSYHVEIRNGESVALRVEKDFWVDDPES
ncbi:MAG: ATP-binding protein [Syntrophomonadaceae bacterium]|nr:ATP-binding protein [Syntrophomonadaceae bacterium]